MEEINKNKRKTLEDIKSTEILKRVFSFLYDKQRLSIISYNKYLQDKLKVHIGLYKKISGKYKIGEKNGIGKEYNMQGKMKFEGKYLNGKRNGKGKEYDDLGNLIFEGEYLDGKRKKGLVKEYFNINKSLVEFEGEYKNGKKSGKGKKYRFHGSLDFEGEYLNGRKNGKGKEYNTSNGKLKFEGEYRDNKRIKGKEYDWDGNLIFEGLYRK